MSMTSRVVAVALFVLMIPWPAAAQRSAPEDTEGKELAARVKAEFLHAWRNYEKYAWGHDALRPLSKTHYDWYGDSLMMTPVDALDTMILMGLTEEADKTRNLIATKLSFDK